MLDQRLLRDNPELITEQLGRRGMTLDLTGLQLIAKQARDLEEQRSNLQAEGNRIGKEVGLKIKAGAAANGPEVQALRDQGNRIKQQVAVLEEEEEDGEGDGEEADDDDDVEIIWVCATIRRPGVTFVTRRRSRDTPSSFLVLYRIVGHSDIICNDKEKAKSFIDLHRFAKRRKGQENGPGQCRRGDEGNHCPSRGNR